MLNKNQWGRKDFCLHKNDLSSRSFFYIQRIALYNLISYKVDCDFFLSRSDISETIHFLYIQKLLITGGTNVSDRRSRLALRVWDGRILLLFDLFPLEGDT